jgi:hypothetical protein
MKTKIIQNIKSIILALILVLGVSYVSAYSTWAPPTATAPGNNIDAPINAGNVGQIKQGTLWIKGLTTSGGAAANGLIVENGNVGIGATSPGSKLHVKSSSTGSAGAIVVDTPGQANMEFWANGVHKWGLASVPSNGLGIYNFSTSSYPFMINDSNNVGIGTTSPGQKLDVNGYVKGTGLCIGSDCKTAWPTAPTLSCTTVETYFANGSGCAPSSGFTSCTNQCPSGYFVTGCGGYRADTLNPFTDGGTRFYNNGCAVRLSSGTNLYLQAQCCKIQ